MGCGLATASFPLCCFAALLLGLDAVMHPFVEFDGLQITNDILRAISKRIFVMLPGLGGI